MLCLNIIWKINSANGTPRNSDQFVSLRHHTTYHWCPKSCPVDQRQPLTDHETKI